MSNLQQQNQFPEKLPKLSIEELREFKAIYDVNLIRGFINWHNEAFPEYYIRSSRINLFIAQNGES